MAFAFWVDGWSLRYNRGRGLQHQLEEQTADSKASGRTLATVHLQARAAVHPGSSAGLRGGGRWGALCVPAELHAGNSIGIRVRETLDRCLSAAFDKRQAPSQKPLSLEIPVFFIRIKHVRRLWEASPGRAASSAWT
ncbi:hypothetical protein Efla_000223 [Eimeria flavescens]